VALLDGNGSRTQWAYDSMGWLTTKTYADGSAYQYAYCALQLLVMASFSRSAGELVHCLFVLGADGVRRMESGPANGN
jgi:YD repeat-containing protein